jgi:hypothetical protein
MLPPWRHCSIFAPIYYNKVIILVPNNFPFFTFLFHFSHCFEDDGRSEDQFLRHELTLHVYIYTLELLFWTNALPSSPMPLWARTLFHFHRADD